MMARSHIFAAGFVLFLLGFSAVSILMPSAPNPALPRIEFAAATMVSADGLDPFAERVRPHFSAQVSEGPQRSVLEDYAVIGSVETDGRNIILMSGLGQVRSLEVGDQIEGYTLIELGDGQARFESEAGEVTLLLPF